VELLQFPGPLSPVPGTRLLNMPADIHATALRALARRALSRREIAQRLERKGFGAGAIRAEVARLAAAGLLDDAELARSVARYQLQEARGRRSVAAVLRRRGVDREAAKEALAGIADGDEGEALAHALARAGRKYPGFRRLPQARRKVIRYLLARGFGAAAVGRALASDPGEDADAVEAEMVEP
jgi:regulatory protein